MTLKRINKGKVKRCISSVSPIGGDIAFSDLQVQPSPRTEQTPEDKRRTTLTSREEAHCYTHLKGRDIQTFLQLKIANSATPQTGFSPGVAMID